MRKRISVPVKVVNNEDWGDLQALSSQAHEICGYDVRQLKDMSFAGQHRMRLYRFKGNVHWRIPSGVPYDVTDVQPGKAPRRQRQ